jgi:hypothetical protein
MCSRINIFSDIFTYESTSKQASILRSKDETVFHDCVLLTDIGRFKKGDIINSITLDINMFLYNDEDDYEEQEIIV